MTGEGHVSANLARFLKGLAFPAEQTELLEQAKVNGADQGVLEVLSKMPKRASRRDGRIPRGFGAGRLR